MKLKRLKIRNFRGYRNEVSIEMNDLTVIVGKNDAGKSTILEALEIFFNNSIVKIEREDLNIDALAAGENRIEITCIFSNLPLELVIDAANATTLANEHLLNIDGDLEIKKIYTCGAAAPRESVFIIANHPTVENANDLLLLKRADLKARAQGIGVNADDYNGAINATMRAAIWNFVGDLQLALTEIQVDKEEAKAVWEYLKRWMPQFALFKSDRASSDGDKEVTNPMKVAVDSAIAGLAAELEDIQQRIMVAAIDVADRTLVKLHEMNPALAAQLIPEFKAEPKWSSLFSLTLNDDRQISINKRGSGVRRLIVLNFFRAEAERRRAENNSQAIIYAFEEPENSQHPDHQQMLIKAFQELADSDNTQVFTTTHNPALAGLVNDNDLRLVTQDDLGNTIVQDLSIEPQIMRAIANTLGMLPEPLKPRLLVCVEGPHDITFFKNISATINANRPDLPNLATDPRIAIFPLGGGTLKDWVTHDYLNGLGIPQYHIYDLDDAANPPYEAARDAVRARGGDNWAELTTKKECENYLHPDCIQNVFGHAVVFGDMDDVPEIVASTVNAAGGGNPWAGLSTEVKKKKMGVAKKRLNNEVSLQMTWAQIQVSDAGGDIVRWLEDIRDKIQ